VYTLTATQTGANGEQAVQSSGFVVPYSPEYGLTGTDRNKLEALARRTGGKLISDPIDAFAHTLPSVGAPRPLWPLLMVLASMLLVADVGVRRVRISAPELRAGYGELRRRLGYVDEVSSASSRPLIGGAHALQDAAPAGGLISARTAHSAARGVRSRALEATSHSGRLLAAKRRAARR
jgi:hypothetical protein